MSGSSLGPEKQTGKDQKKQFTRSKLTVSHNPRTLHVCTKRDKEKEPKTKGLKMLSQARCSRIVNWWFMLASDSNSQGYIDTWQKSTRVICQLIFNIVSMILILHYALTNFFFINKVTFFVFLTIDKNTFNGFSNKLYSEKVNKRTRSILSDSQNECDIY